MIDAIVLLGAFIVVGALGMVKVTNVMGDEYSGQVGKAGVFAKWKGINYRRKYVVPSNPQTTKQTEVRGFFTNAVDYWHVFLTIQRQAYGYMAAGKAMSGFNLYVSRICKLLNDGDPATDPPVMGYVQVGSDSTNVPAEVIPASEAVITLANANVKQTTVVITENTMSVDIAALVELNRGIVRRKDAIAVPKISYTSGGRSIVNEVITWNEETDEDYYRVNYWPIDAGSCHVYDGAVEKDAIEIDLEAGKLYFTLSVPDDNTGRVNYDYIEPVEDARLEVVKADTQFVAARKYTNAYGVIVFALTTEDQNYDTSLVKSGYESELNSNVAASTACKDEYIELAAA